MNKLIIEVAIQQKKIKIIKKFDLLLNSDTNDYTTIYTGCLVLPVTVWSRARGVGGVQFQT